MGMGRGKACFTQHSVARRGQGLLRGAGSPCPSDEQHSSCRQKQALPGVHLQASPFQLLQGKGSGKSKRPTGHLWHHITPDCWHTGVLEWMIHNMYDFSLWWFSDVLIDCTTFKKMYF